MNTQNIGYIRVSSVDQNEARQLVDHTLNKVFIDKVSGKSIDRPQLKLMIDFVREGDTVFVHSLDRLARNLDDLRSIVKTLISKKVKIVFIKENLTFSGDDSPMANLLLSVMGAFAEFERDLIKERQREGIAIAKANGVYKGRQFSLSEHQRLELKEDLSVGKLSKVTLAEKYGLSRQSIYRYKGIFSMEDDAPGFENDDGTLDMECNSCGKTMKSISFWGKDIDPEKTFSSACEHCGEEFHYSREAAEN